MLSLELTHLEGLVHLHVPPAHRDSEVIKSYVRWYSKLIGSRSTVAFFLLFFFLDLAFLMLGIGWLRHDAMGMPYEGVIQAGGFFGLLSAFAAWYNALAGMLDDSNRYVGESGVAPLVASHC